MLRIRLAAAALLAILLPEAAQPDAGSDCGTDDHPALVTRVIDGDTVEADIDLGLGVWLSAQRIRLIGVEAPEIRGEERALGLPPAAALRDRIEGARVVLCTYGNRRDGFGRWLAEIFHEGESVNTWLLSEDLAGYRRGRIRPAEPAPPPNRP